jgi:flagellar basal body P-ring protein FlgI
MHLKKLFTTTALLAALSGCTEPAPKTTPKYATLGPRTDLPEYLNDTIMQYTDLGNTQPAPVSGYGIVVHLQGTGGSRVPTPVRDFMIKELARHDFGSAVTGWAAPEDVLRSKDVAIVRVDGVIPVGARAGTNWSTWFDCRVTIPQESDATSLAHGDLYQCDLKVNGANPSDPGSGMVEVKAQAAGPIYINPSYVIDGSLDTPDARAGRKTGIILDGARVMQDRPLLLRLRTPGNRIARGIEARIIEHFADVVDDDLRPDSGSDHASDKKVANAMDEGVIYVYVPKVFNNDVEHFVGVMRHLYLGGDNPQFAAIQAAKLADAALQPNAKLGDISYAWEGLGPPALHAIQPLLSSNIQEVQFAAARAAAFLNDPAAVPVLLQIASTPLNPYRVNAVTTLASLPATPRIDRLCRVLLDSDEASVREAAYELLAKHQDSSIYTRWITNGKREVFALDIIDSRGKPLVYATSQGIPRIAVFGSLQLELPLIYTSLDQRLTISSQLSGPNVDISYRGQKFVSTESTPSLAEIIARLAGDDETGVSGMHLGYADVVGIVQQLIDQKRVTGRSGDARLLAAFMLQEPSTAFEPLNTARPLLRPEGRPQSDQPSPGDKPADDHLLRQPTTAPVAVGPG